ncbi:MAG: hypothetical protein QOK15_212 [Nocardioidaceae bacterium]|nr:hypothetical protein [Nocardioidaceae bacterium]
MSTRTLRDLRRRRHGPEITTLRTAADRDPEIVHLVSLTDEVPAQESLCRKPITRQVPRRLFHEAGCAACVAVALDRGVACAEDRHGALVNLRRLRLGGEDSR